ncbi:Sec-independent protein translocase subunit TatA [Janibacter alittae]|uniref:Sec-independent protein translocase protein TatA n=1 Tax=Janibacter alittae TaxID=3115209 RepID=A0ABZ2MD38_9MICO
MPSLGPMEIVLILVVILLLFGFKKLPDAARSLGKSARVFKAEVSEMKEEDRQREAEKSARESGTVESTTTESAPADDAKPRTDNESGPVG